MIKRSFKIAFVALILSLMMAFASFNSFNVKAAGTFSGDGQTSAMEGDDLVYTLNTTAALTYSETTGDYDYVTFKFRPNETFGGDDQAHITLYIPSGSSYVSFKIMNYWKAITVLNYSSDFSSATTLMDAVNYAANNGGGWTNTSDWVEVKIGYNTNFFYFEVGGTGFTFPNTNHYDLKNKTPFFGSWSCAPSMKDFALSNNTSWASWTGNFDVAEGVYTANDTAEIKRLDYTFPTHADTLEFKVKYNEVCAGDTANVSFYISNGSAAMRMYIYPYWNYVETEFYNADFSVCTQKGKAANYEGHGTHGAWDSTDEWITFRFEFASKNNAAYINNAMIYRTCTNYNFDFSNCTFFFGVWGCKPSIKDISLTDAGLTPAHTPVIDEAVAATCTATGLTAGTHCSECNEVLVAQETVAALGHDLVDDAAVAATCTTAGKTAGHHCSRCDYKDGGETIAALGHSASSQTYHTDDKHFNICTRCGFVLDFEDQTVQTDYTDARWTQRKYTTDWATMSGQMRVREKNGSKVVNMAAGNSTTMQYILNFNGTTPIAKGNAFTIDLGNYFSGAKPMGVKVSLLVKVGGYTQTVYVLGSTDDYYTFPVTTAFETFTYVADMEVEVYEIRITNKSNNSGNFYLYMDNVRIFTAMNTANHTMNDDPTAPAQAATCTEAGKTAGKVCSCGYKVEGTAIDALGHDLVEDAAIAPTCTEAGKEAGHHCSRCEYTDGGATIAATGHTEVTDAAVAPTCTATGKTEGKHCSVCNAVLVAQETVAALGHDLVDDAAVAPTCTEAGKEAGHHCTRCDYTDGGATIPSKGHTLVDDLAIAPTCTEAGKTAGQHCSVCNAVLVAQEDVPATGHTEETDPAVAPTCTEAGLTEGKHCSVCNAVITAQQEVPATGHDWGEWVVTTPATTTSEGVETRTCKNDPTHTETRPIDRLPDTPTTQAPVTQAPATQAPATQAPKTDAPAQTGKKGCKSSIGAIAVITPLFMAGIAYLSVKKRKEF